MFLNLCSDRPHPPSLSRFRPSRISAVLAALEEFLTSFFDSNPLAQVSIIQTSNSRASYVSRMGGQPREKLEQLRNFVDQNGCNGDGSLGAVLNLISRSNLSLIKIENNFSVSKQEVLVLWSSLSTFDVQPLFPDSIEEVLGSTSNSVLPINVVCLGPEIFALTKVASLSGGKHFVASDPQRLSKVLSTFVQYQHTQSEFQPISRKCETKALWFELCIPEPVSASKLMLKVEFHFYLLLKKV